MEELLQAKQEVEEWKEEQMEKVWRGVDCKEQQEKYLKFVAKNERFERMCKMTSSDQFKMLFVKSLINLVTANCESSLYLLHHFAT